MKQQGLKAWVVGGRSLARRSKSSCVRCRFLGKLVERQKKVQLPLRIVVPCPVFTHLEIDLAGPFKVTGERGGMATLGQ